MAIVLCDTIDYYVLHGKVRPYDQIGNCVGEKHYLLERKCECMTIEEIEELIRELYKEIAEKELCMFPYKESYNCCDCYLCHIDYYKPS